MWVSRASQVNARGGSPSAMRWGCVVITMLSLWFGGWGASRVASTAEWFESGTCGAEDCREVEIVRLASHRVSPHNERNSDDNGPGRPGSETGAAVDRLRTVAGRAASMHLIGSGIGLRC